VEGVNRVQWRKVGGLGAVWLVLSAALGVAFFLSSSLSTTFASHDAVIRPTVDGWVTVHTGPFLPDVRSPSDSVLGVDIQLGKTEAGSTDELVARYAFIASQPDAPANRVRDSLRDLAYDGAARGAVTALIPLLLWAAVGRERRHEIGRALWARKELSAVVAVAAVGLGLLVWEPWEEKDPTMEEGSNWQALGDYLPTAVELPSEAADLEITGDLTTSASRRLVLSALDTYSKSKEFYAAAADKAAGIEVRRPVEGETVAIFVSDRHDNVGMDQVIRAIGEEAGATAILDGGDDTSTGEEWEAFSLDSLTSTFEDLDRWAVTGNHDHGGFVHEYLEREEWVVDTGEAVAGPGGSRILLVDDPRSSGLGNWRDEPGLSITELGAIVADELCAAHGDGERVNTLLVHDSDVGTPALAQGCVDLVLSGHVHVRVGPEQVVGANGEIGYTYTTGTAGGAAYAIAVGSKLRREAVVSLVTFSGGRPIGIQSVALQTNGVFSVSDWTALPYADAQPSQEAAGDAPPPVGGPSQGRGNSR
jgi:hypothetical protein